MHFDVRLWHKCEVPTESGKVCWHGQAGHPADITKPTRLTQSRHDAICYSITSSARGKDWRAWYYLRRSGQIPRLGPGLFESVPQRDLANAGRAGDDARGIPQ